MAAEENATLVRELFAAFERKASFALRHLFADEAVWRVPGRSVLAGEYRGPREIVRFLGSIPRLTDETYTSTLVDVLALPGDPAAFDAFWGAP